MFTTSRPRRRALAVAAPALAAALLLSGCGRGDGAADTAADIEIDDSPATGTLSLWIGSGEADALEGFLDEFAAENPDVEIELTNVPSDSLDTKLTTAIASGEVPDLTMLYSQTQSTMLATGGFAPVPEGLVESDAFFEPAYDGTLIDGVSHAVPWYAYANVWYYRKDLVEAAGATPPATWDETRAFAEQLEAAGHPMPLGLDVGYDAYSAQALDALVHQNDGSLISDDLASWTIDTPENVEALDFWGSLFAEGDASPDGPLFLDTVPWFTSGQTVAGGNGPWFPGFLDEANGEGWAAEHLGSIVPPAGPGGTVSANFGGGSLAVPKDAANAGAAWKLARYLAEPEVQVAWYEAFGNLPTTEAAWDEPVIADDPLLAAVRDALPHAVAVPAVPTWSEVGAVIGQQMERVARGEASAQEALAEAQAQAEAIGTGIE